MRATHGFTLLEMVVAMAIFSMVFAGLWSVQRTLMSNQGRIMARFVLESDRDKAEGSLRRAASESTAIQTPAPGAASAQSATFLSNIDAADGATALSSVSPPAFNHFCMAPDGTLRRYEGPTPVPAITCGSPVPGTTDVVVAGSPDGRTRIEVLFIRPASEPNAVVAHFNLTLAPAARRPAETTSWRTRVTVAAPTL